MNNTTKANLDRLAAVARLPRTEQATSLPAALPVRGLYNRPRPFGQEGATRWRPNSSGDARRAPPTTTQRPRRITPPRATTRPPPGIRAFACSNACRMPMRAIARRRARRRARSGWKRSASLAQAFLIAAGRASRPTPSTSWYDAARATPDDEEGGGFARPWPPPKGDRRGGGGGGA